MVPGVSPRTGLFLHPKSLTLKDLMHQMCCSVHDFPCRPSWEARSQQDHFGIECLIPQTAESSSGIASVHRGGFSLFFSSSFSFS